MLRLLLKQHIHASKKLLDTSFMMDMHIFEEEIMENKYENKVTLISADDVVIGETFMRRAKQLVRRQRAQWTDDSQTAIRFYPEMENMVDVTADASMGATAIDMPDTNVQINQLCFARWGDGYYYPGVISDIRINHIRVAYLDGYIKVVPKEYVMELQKGFETLKFQGRWQGWFFCKGELTNIQPLIMNYNDGEVEQIDLKHLRGKIPKKFLANLSNIF